MPLGIVCGFRAEEKIAAAITPMTAIGWHNPGAAASLIARGATALVSFGLAGGLDPALAPGDLLIPGKIVFADGARHPTSPDLHEQLLKAFPAAGTEPLAATASVLATPAAKQRLFATTGAAAADMESEAVARAALAAGIPFAVLRAVSDPACHALPPAALGALDANGNIDIAAVLLSLLRDPFQLPALLETGKQSRLALRRLAECVTPLRQALG